MDKNKIRLKIATDLRGKPSRNPLSLIPVLAKSLGLSESEINNEVGQMKDLKHIVPATQNPNSIRLSDEGEQSYFATKEERVSKFWKHNWPHITSNIIAFLALGVAIWSLIQG